MNRREFLKKGLEGIIVGIPLIYNCGKNPVEPESEKLSIKTEKNIYIWQLGESNKILYIKGALENISKNIYYSKLGDFYNSASEQDPLFIERYSGGHLEKYNEVNSIWYEINILADLEGSKFVCIKPSKIYSIDAYLLVKKDEEEKGKYRFRIDYYGQKPYTLPYKDYSNTFEIK